MEISDQKPWKKWNYVLLPGFNPDRRFLNHYNQAYELWRNVWQETLSSLDGVEVLHSDEFTRQDCIGAVFEGDRCLMLSFFREMDLSLRVNQEDSYFKYWSKSAMKSLMRDSSHIIVASNVTLAPEVRGRFHGLSMKDLILNLLVEYGKHSEASAQSGSTRNNKGMNRVAVSAGAELIESGVTMHGLDSDIHAFYKTNVERLINEWTPIVREMWARRLVVGHHETFTSRKVA